MIKTAALIAFALAGSLASTAAASPFKLKDDGLWVTTAKDREACGADAGLAWCSPQTVERVSFSDWSVGRVAQLQASLTAQFQYSYATDLPWRSHFAEAAAGARWVDDCDGLTFTVLDALSRAGFPRDKMWRAVVSPQGNASYVMHMVGIVEVDGLYLVVGDSDHSAPYPLAKAKFKPQLLSKVSEGARWKRAALNARPLARPL